MKREKVLELMTQEIETAPYDGEVTIVVYDRQGAIGIGTPLAERPSTPLIVRIA
jgi:hypothetical protein